MNENLFDYEFYTNLYEDLKNLKKEEAYNHYITKGKNENRICNKRRLYEIFDYDFYINLYDDVKKIGNKNEAFKHFINNGIHEERLINNEFNTTYQNFNWEFYLYIYNLDVDLLNTKYKVFMYYLEYNIDNNIHDVYLFDKDFYKEYDNFDWEFYILLYNDLKNLNIDSKKKAYFHYIIFGKDENRIIDKNINYEYKFANNIYRVNYNYFNWESYINNNIDIININTKESAFLHFIQYGINENRVYDENLCDKINKFDFYFYSSLYDINLNILSEEDVYNHFNNNKKNLDNNILIEKKQFLNYKNDIFITFIIPTIGRESLIIAINSLFNLNRSNWTAIIIFDGVKKNINIDDERIIIIELEKKEGSVDKYNKAGYVRNIGFSYLKNSEWVGFLDDDDSLSDDYIEKLENEISLNSSLDVCIFRMIYANNIILPGKIDKSINKNRIGISFALKGYITKNIKFSNSQYEDYFYLKELEYKNYKIVISPYICYYVRMSQIDNIDNKNNNNNLDRILLNFNY